MNDSKKIDVETCFSELKEAVFDALVEPKKQGRHLDLAEIESRAEISDRFQSTESESWYALFTRALLAELQYEKRVKQHGSYWELTDRGMLKKWFCDPNTPEDAWMKLKFSEIDTKLGTKHACKEVPKIVAKKTDKTEKEVREKRNAFRKRNGLPLR